VSERHPALIVASQKPFNAETPAELLASKMETPNEFFYVRNHLPVPQVDPKAFRLTVTAEGVSKTLELSLDELKQMFPVHTISGAIR
jgi:sulfite oxidase